LQVGGSTFSATEIAWTKKEGGWMGQEFWPGRGQTMSRLALKNCGPPRRKLRFKNLSSIAFSIQTGRSTNLRSGDKPSDRPVLRLTQSDGGSLCIASFSLEVLTLAYAFAVTSLHTLHNRGHLGLVTIKG
jgi:hypothetical protein